MSITLSHLFLLNKLYTPFSDRSVPEQSPIVITGYVHKITDVLYIDFNLQLSPSKVVRRVSSSPEKHAKLKETHQNIAVKIDQVQASIARGRASEQEYIAKKNSCITPSAVPYNYIFSDIFHQ